MALREGNSALHWAATRPEDNTPATAVAVGHFVQVPIWEAGPISNDTPLTAAGADINLSATPSPDRLEWRTRTHQRATPIRCRH